MLFKYRVSEKYVHTRCKWDRGWCGSHKVNVLYSVFYIANVMQLIQCSLLLSSELYMFRAVFPPIIRSL
jgi:hypothetical protein